MDWRKVILFSRQRGDIDILIVANRAKAHQDTNAMLRDIRSAADDLLHLRDANV